MTQKIAYIPYQDYNMEQEMLVDSRFYDIFSQKMDEVMVIGRLKGYRIGYESKDYFDKAQKQRSFNHHIQFKNSNDKNVFILNLYTHCYGTRLHHSSIHHFSGGNYEKYKTTIPLFFEYFSDKEHFKKGFDWIEFKSIQDLIIGLTVFKHALQKI